MTKLLSGSRCSHRWHQRLYESFMPSSCAEKHKTRLSRWTKGVPLIGPPDKYPPPIREVPGSIPGTGDLFHKGFLSILGWHFGEYLTTWYRGCQMAPDQPSSLGPGWSGQPVCIFLFIVCFSNLEAGYKFRFTPSTTHCWVNRSYTVQKFAQRLQTWPRIPAPTFPSVSLACHHYITLPSQL